MKRFLLAVVGVIAVVGVLVWLRGHQKAAQNAAREAAGQSATPVAVGRATYADVPVTLDGIGTVQALYTVNIHPMVDGPLGQREISRGPGCARR